MQIPLQDLQGVVLLFHLTTLGFLQPISARQNACYNVSAVTVSDISARVLEKVLYCEIMTYIGNVTTDSQILGLKLSLQ
jgi:hypothetical protein